MFLVGRESVKLVTKLDIIYHIIKLDLNLFSAFLEWSRHTVFYAQEKHAT